MIKASIPWTTKQVHKMVTNGSLVFDNAIQRGYVWDNARKSLLIDSILRSYPVPPMYTIRDGRTVTTPKGDVAVFDALDGKQRCLTITKFKNNEFALTGVDSIIDENGDEIFLEGLKYEDLSDSLRDTFDSFSINVIYFTDITDEEVVEIMARLNNGKPLSASEKTRIQAPDLAGIRRLATHPLFTENFTEKAIDGYQNEDSAIKMYMIAHGKYALDNKDTKGVYGTLDVTAEIEKEMKDIFDYVDDVHAKLLDADEKKLAKKVITRTHLISLTKTVIQAMADGKTASEFADFCKDFYNGSPSKSDEYNIACTNGSNHQSNVEARLDALDVAYQDFFA